VTQNFGWCYALARWLRPGQKARGRRANVLPLRVSWLDC